MIVDFIPELPLLLIPSLSSIYVDSGIRNLILAY
jgi:hypothetical protein